MAGPDRPSRPPWMAGLATRPVAVVLLLACVAVLSYANTFHASFHFDDAGNITDNDQLRHLPALRDLSGTRSVGFLTFAVNYAVGGLNPVGYHLINLLIHIANGLLIYFLVGLLGRTPWMHTSGGRDSQTHTHGIALATALLFVVHPIQTQAVTYIVQRFTSLAALFYLLAVVSYLQWRLADPARRARYGWYAAALAATVLAMKTKEHTFTLPLMLLLIEGVAFGRRPWSKWRSLVPFVLLLPLIPLSLTWEVGLEDGDLALPRETMQISRLSYLATQCRVLVTYLRLMVWPAGQNVDYDYPIAHSLLELPVLASGLLLVGLLGLALCLVARSERWGLAGLGVLWFFVTVSVESSIIPIRDVIFEHRMYLPSVGLLLAGSIMVATLLARRRAVSVIVLMTVVALLAGATYERNTFWADEITLWRDAVAKSPRKARAHNNLGLAFLSEGQRGDAMTEFATALRLKPDIPQIHTNLGIVYAELGQVDAAISEYRAAIQVKPNFPDAYFNLGNAYAQQGLASAAIPAYQTAVRLRPDHAQTHYNLGGAYLTQGQLDDAVAELATALRLKPDYPEAHLDLGIAYGRQGRLAVAIQEYEAAIRLRPDYAEARTNLGNAYLAEGRSGDAIEEYRTAISLKPDLPDAHADLGNAYAQQGQLAAAIGAYQTALRLRPDYAEAHYDLGRAYLIQGRPDDAIAELVAALRLRPDDPAAHYNLGMAYAARGEAQAAIQAYRRAIERNPDLPEPHNNLGYTYLGLGRLKEASAEFQTALRLQPAYLDAQYNLGIARSRQRRWEEASQAFLATLRLKPDLPEAEAKLGAVYQQQGRWDDAIAHYQRALQQRANWVDVRILLGRVYLRKGLVPEARREFEAAVRLRPDSAPARQALKQLDGHA